MTWTIINFRLAEAWWGRRHYSVYASALLLSQHTAAALPQRCHGGDVDVFHFCRSPPTRRCRQDDLAGLLPLCARRALRSTIVARRPNPDAFFRWVHPCLSLKWISLPLRIWRHTLGSFRDITVDIHIVWAGRELLCFDMRKVYLELTKKKKKNVFTLTEQLCYSLKYGRFVIYWVMENLILTHYRPAMPFRNREIYFIGSF